jgi:cytochrome P450/NADPH-cytochrome P450 reductase
MSSSLSASSIPQPRIPQPRIPQPRPLPWLGNVLAIDPHAPVQSITRLGQKYGPIFRLAFPSQTLTVLGSHELVADACDESRFDKHVHGPLREIRSFAGDGLFTAETTEPNWGKAHRLLMPAFGPAAMRDYFDDMLEIADQMLTKWARLGAEASIDVPDSMTRLTLDTIALSGFGFRFNSFYQHEMHPFVDAMVGALAEAGQRGRRTSLQNRMMMLTQQKYVGDARLMHAITDELVARRKKEPRGARARDLLGLMLEAKDPLTGERLDDENIRNQLVTFLIAGHETTSGLLSFATYLLLENPHVLETAREHVQAAMGDELPRFPDLAKLGYLDQILRETLRLYPTAPAFAVHALEPTTLAGRYEIGTDDVLLALLPMLHRDPEVWPEPEKFDPDRFSAERRGSIPIHAWKPFGNGQRSCIGRAFALQEATLVLAMMIQRFDLELASSEELVIKETLTLKPDGLRIRARARAPGLRALRRDARDAPSAPLARAGEQSRGPAARGSANDGSRKVHGTGLLVLYGSNSGASEAFARRIASDGAARGYAAQVATLDERAGALGPGGGAVVIVTSSYNGAPPDNARRFCAALAEAPAGSLASLRHVVFGCGHSDWAGTYQAVPTQIDRDLTAAGSTALVPRGAADARGDFFGDFERWYATFWEPLDRALGVKTEALDERALYDVEVVPSAALELASRAGLSLATVVENRELVDMASPLGRSKRHVVIALPEGVAYEAGDYLAVLPENPPEVIVRMARRFGLTRDTAVVLRSSRGAMAASLPIDRPISVGELLARHVELGSPATRRTVERLAASNPCPPHRAELLALAGDRYETEVLAKRTTVLDLLESFPSCGLTFAEMLELLPAMRVRQYSISSSPLRDPAHCSLTVAVVDAPAWSGQGRFRGACSTYLARLAAGDRLAVAVRRPNAAFRPPADNATPMILVGAGTGIAPLRSFLEERASRPPSRGRAMLFFGCDHPEVDFLYRDELAAMEASGFLEVHAAFSRQPTADEEGEIAFVQHRLWRERARVHAAIEAGAHVFLCGDGERMAPAVRATLARIHAESAGGSLADGERWLADLERAGRFASDVFV